MRQTISFTLPDDDGKEAYHFEADMLEAGGYRDVIQLRCEEETTAAVFEEAWTRAERGEVGDVIEEDSE
jgi:hypothetical protein